MAPRKGERRMDAALAAMKPMGFPQSTVRKKVKELLELYGRPHGWAFIEEASYKLLIDVLLEGDEEPAPVVPSLTSEGSNQDNMLGDGGSSSGAVGSSSVAGGPSTTITPLMDPTKTSADDTSHQDLAPTLANTDTTFPPPAGPIAPLSRRRRPCYGWFGDDSDDEIIHLPKMPVPVKRPGGERVYRR